MKKLKILFPAAISSALILAAILSLKPIPKVSQKEALLTEGIVTKIYPGGKNDIIIELANSDRSFYINRGKEAGLRTDELRNNLVGKQVSIYYPDYWTPLDWNGRFKHLSSIEQAGRIIYSEFDA